MSYTKNCKKSLEKAGWVFLTGDVNWEDYGGKWGKKGPDGAWYILRFENMLDAVGERDLGDDDKYLCEVRRIDLKEVPREEIESAIRGCGPEDMDLGSYWKHDGTNQVLEFPAKGTKTDLYAELAIVDSLDSYGVAAPMESFSGNVRPTSVRANARRYAEELMDDVDAVETALDKPVNALGSTARDFGQGNPLAGQERYVGEVLAGEREPTDEGQNLVFKMYHGGHELADLVKK